MTKKLLLAIILLLMPSVCISAAYNPVTRTYWAGNNETGRPELVQYVYEINTVPASSGSAVINHLTMSEANFYLQGVSYASLSTDSDLIIKTITGTSLDTFDQIFKAIDINLNYGTTALQQPVRVYDWMSNGRHGLVQNLTNNDAALATGTYKLELWIEPMNNQH